jgi:alkylated DNA repair dioxygenase AlkB
VTFGCEREFKMRRFDDNSEVHSIMLKHGSLLVMSGETQHFWQHSIPKKSLKKDSTIDLFSSEIRSGEERINLTFRHIH